MRVICGTLQRERERERAWFGCYSFFLYNIHIAAGKQVGKEPRGIAVNGMNSLKGKQSSQLCTAQHSFLSLPLALLGPAAQPGARGQKGKFFWTTFSQWDPGLAKGRAKELWRLRNAPAYMRHQNYSAIMQSGQSLEVLFVFLRKDKLKLNVHIAYAILIKNLLHSIPAVKGYKNSWFKWRLHCCCLRLN